MEQQRDAYLAATWAENLETNMAKHSVGMTEYVLAEWKDWCLVGCLAAIVVILLADKWANSLDTRMVQSYM